MQEETHAEFAEDMERLAHLAYPEAAETMVEVLAKVLKLFDYVEGSHVEEAIRSKEATLQILLEAGTQKA